MGHVLDLRDEGKRMEYGLRPETVLERSQKAKTGHNRAERDDMLQSICNAVYNAPAPLTRLEICRAVNRAKSPHLIALIDELYTRGFIARQQVARAPGQVVGIEYQYAPVEVD